MSEKARDNVHRLPLAAGQMEYGVTDGYAPNEDDPESSERPHLCLILPLPVPEFVTDETQEAPVQPPKNPSRIETVNLQKMFDTRNSSTPQSRTRDLLVYAWQAGADDIPVVPPELAPYVTGDITEWIKNNFDRVQGYTGTKYSILKEITDPYKDSSTLLQNALDIKKKSWGRKEGDYTEVSARMIINDAIEALE